MRGGGGHSRGYVPTVRNLGFAGGNNVGLKACTRDFVLLLNNDTVVHEDSFSPLIDFLERHPKVGIVQGTMNVPALDLRAAGMGSAKTRLPSEVVCGK